MSTLCCINGLILWHGVTFNEWLYLWFKNNSEVRTNKLSRPLIQLQFPLLLQLFSSELLSRNEEISCLKLKLDQLENLSYNELKEENAMLRDTKFKTHLANPMVLISFYVSSLS